MVSVQRPAGEPWQWSAVAAAAAVRAGAITPLELLESALARIDAVEASVNAFVLVDREGAERQAKLLSDAGAAGAWRGMLHGVPIAIKDIFDVEGLPTHCGSPLYDAAGAAPRDAAVVAALRAAGAIIVGKTHTHELACGVYTPASHNPWDLGRSCGGSSGGSGAAVACGEVMVATGSDTGGSIRIPAAVCGIVGLKPTYDLLSRAGVAALSWSLDHIGPLARSVEDAALVMQALLGPASPLPQPVWPVADMPLATVRLGIVDDDVLSRVTDPVRSAFEASCAVLSDAGAELVHVSIPELADTLAIEFAIVMAEAASYHTDAVRNRAALIGDGIRTLFLAGALLPADDYLLAQRLRAKLQRAIAAAYADNALDAIVAPAIPLPAYAPTDETTQVGDREESVIEAAVRTTAPFNLTGLPVVSVPMGVTDEGLPVGLQVAGRPYAEQRVLELAAAYERLRPASRFDELHPIRRSELEPSLASGR